jgi:hypothetical protein
MARTRAVSEKDLTGKILDAAEVKGPGREEVLGEGGLLKQLTGRLLSRILEAETDGAPNLRFAFWMGALNELKNRGVEDILIACMGGLSRRGAGGVSADPRAALDDFGKIRNGKYPMIRQSWENHGNDLSGFFNYPPEIPRAVYTANAIESLNCQLRKVTRDRLTFVNDEAIFKVLYLAIRNASKKRTMPVKQRGMALNQVSHFVRKRAGSALVAKCYLHKTSDRLPKNGSPVSNAPFYCMIII